MLSFNSSSSYNHNPNYGPFSENDITSFTSSISEQDPNFFFPFPCSPHMQFEYDVFNLHFLDPDINHIPNATNMPVEEAPTQLPLPPPSAARRRSSKKDRHSKIDTARGPRDRRMRLSLEIARKFFDLQDLLGYDKASRTVDWLLRNSSSAINELRGSNSSVIISESCTSEDCGESVAAPAAKERRGRKGKRGGGGVQLKRTTVGRESRRKARDRARERTSQKRRLMRERNSDLSSDEARMSTAAITTQGLFCPWNSASEFLHQVIFHSYYVLITTINTNNALGSPTRFFQIKEM